MNIASIPNTKPEKNTAIVLKRLMPLINHEAQSTNAIAVKTPTTNPASVCISDNSWMAANLTWIFLGFPSMHLFSSRPHRTIQ